MIALIGAFGIGIIVGVFIGVIIYAVANETFSIDLSKPHNDCLLYTSPSPRDAHESRMPSSA